MNAPRQPLLLAAALLAAAMAASAAEDSKQLEAEVRRLIGSAECTAAEQCRTIAFGAKACGGPQGYLAWSTLVTDGAALAVAAERHAARRRDELRAGGMVSDCSLVADPGATCAPADAAGARTCRLQGGTRGARSAR